MLLPVVEQSHQVTVSARLRTEAILDEALARALFNEPSIAAWFLARTLFASEVASCVFCRCDNPWSSVRLEVRNALTDEVETLVRQCETDVLAVFAIRDGRRLALHIENKLAGGSFTPHQPELYRARKSQWKSRDKLGAYTDATTVLVAPKVFYERLRERSTLFDSYISHEEISEYVPEFGAAPSMGA
jgi:hypothetical protein